MEFLLKELIPNISLYLSIFDINNLICSHRKFNNSFDINWNRYFKIHLGIDIKLNKNNLIEYSGYLVTNLNFCRAQDTQNSLINVVNGFVNFRNKRDTSNKLIFIDKIVQKYQHHVLYNKLIKNHKPIFLHRSDFIASYLGHIYNKTKLLLSNHLDKIIIVDDNLNFNNSDTFGQEALDAIKDFSIHNKDRILIINKNEFK